MSYKLRERKCGHCGNVFMGRPQARHCSHGCASKAAAARRFPDGRAPCSVADCNRDSHAGGLCHMHYRRLLRVGSPAGERRRRPHGVSVEEWFWINVEKTDSCWVWTGSVLTLRGGHGYIWDGERKLRAHHFLVGRPDDGMEWHHTCGEVRCVRPEHLDLIPRSEHRRLHG